MDDWHEIESHIMDKKLSISQRLTFLMIITKKGSLMPNVFLGSAGHWMKVVLTLVPIISNTDDWMSGSVIRLMCPFLTAAVNKAMLLVNL